MKKLTIEVDNLKCGGCESTISKQIFAINGVKNVIVDADSASVEIHYEGEGKEPVFLKTLAKLGYPIKGTTTSFQKAKSYVSCAVGKITKD